MKIAIVNWLPHLDGRVMGSVMAGYYIHEALERLGHQSTQVTASTSGRKNQAIPDRVHCYKFKELHEVLNRFDAIIFCTTSVMEYGAPPTEVTQVIEKITKPFVYFCHDEREDQVYKGHRLSYEMNKNCRAAVFICEGFEDYIKTTVPFIYSACWPSISVTEYPKSNLVVSTSRIVSSKRLEELLQAAPELEKMGYEVQMWGTQQHYFTWQKLLEYGVEKYYKGYYHPDQRPQILSPARFHFNVFNSCKQVKYAKRIELATVEALSYGCIPITNRNSAPDWFKYLQYTQPSDIPTQVALWEEFAPVLMSEVVAEVNKRSLDVNLPKVIEVLR